MSSSPRSRTELKTILYVDDEPDIREVVQMSLQLIGGVTIHTCESAEAALEKLPKLRPDLVLLDVMMPRMDGPTMLMRMHADPAFAHVPVIFMTAKALPQEIARFREMGAVAVIPKPFDPIQLGSQVVAIWEGLPRA
jgi:two-component system, OmpR family, response regulator